MQRRGPTLLLLMVSLFLAACADVVPQDPGSPLFAKKCNVRREDCSPPPPPVTVEPKFQGPARDFVSPVRVATTSSGWLLVSDSDGEVVHRVDPAQLVSDRTMKVEGRPNAVGMLNDLVFVGNVTTKTVEVYSHTGQLMGALGTAGSVAWPADLAVDSALGLVFVLDRGVPEVKIYQLADWSQIGAVAQNGLVTPTGLTVDPAAEEILVADAGAPGGGASVVIYGYDGAFKQAISGAGSCGMMGCSGGFSTPASVAVDSLAHVYVVDNLLGAVLVYDRALSLTKAQRTLGGRGVAGAPQLAFPLDVGVVGQDVMVTSKRSHRVDVYRGGVQ